jgi:hypothetical protein
MLEPYKEIVNYDKFFFFEGVASLKYGGDFNRYRSEMTGEKHFSHRVYYNVEVKRVRQLSTDDFKEWKKKFELRNIKNNSIIVHFNNSEYEINTDVLYLHDSIQPSHVQYEGEELHSEFTEVPVLFKMHRTEEGIVCKKGVSTGKEEWRDGVLFREITTGEMESDGETCSTVWIPEIIEEPKLTCIKDKPTGNREIKDNCYRLEYYTGRYNEELGECETYWGEWKCEGYPPPPTPPPGCLSGLGCFGIIFWSLVLLWAFLCVRWAILYHSFMPILFGIGIPLVLFGLGYLLNFLARFSIGIGRVFSWLLNLLLLIGILSLLNGLFSIFEGGQSVKPLEDTSWTDQQVEDVDPYDQNETTVLDSLQQQRKRIHLRWSDFSNVKYKGAFDLSINDIRRSSYRLKELEAQHLNRYYDVYSSVYDNDKNALGDLYIMLDSIRDRRGQDRITFANTIVTMIQSIEYVLILDKGCNDPYVLRNQQIRELLRSGVACSGYAPYGIRTPLEFFTTMEGDCDTRTLLLYTILKHYNYDVAILNSDVYGHSILGLSIPGARGAYKYHQGKKYYFWETTSFGNRLGELDRSIGNINYWKIEIN